MNDIDNTGMLYRAILSLKTPEECRAFFEDLCTPQELKAMAQRIKVAQLLKSGENYKTITSSTGASTATISRVNKTMTYQTAGGYDTVLRRIGEK